MTSYSVGVNMAKWCWCIFVVLLIFSVIPISQSLEAKDAEFYHYKTEAAEAAHGLHVRLQRDVAAAAASDIVSKPLEEDKLTGSPSLTTDKKPMDAPKKDDVDKFPETKKPTSYNADKLDKYDKFDKKKPLGKPGEKPVFTKPDSVDTSSYNSSETSSASSSNISVATTEPLVTTTVVTPAAAAASTTTTTTTPPPPPPPAAAELPPSTSTANSPPASNTSWSSGTEGSGSMSSIDVKVDDDLATEDDMPGNVTGYNTNITKSDHHKYYNSFGYSGQEVMDHYWVKLEHLPENFITESKLLSSAHRQAFTLSLPFEFPFYGHLLTNITIATGGFLYTGDLLHTWLAATQYIAPLMANFDTSASNDSKVKYAENGTALTVQWENVKLKEKLDGGAFTFQVTIHNSGDIVFAYKDVPVAVDLIADDEHPVKVGLSDAYIVHKTIFYMRRKTIYEYHKINLKKRDKVANWTAILFKALPTCVSFTDCNSCVTQNTSFQCRWCEKVGRCSDGMDRHRQDWLISRCDFFNTDHPEQCVARPAVATPVEANAAPPNTQAITGGEEREPTSMPNEWTEKEMMVVSDAGSTGEGGGSSAGVTVAILVCLLLCVVGWVAYAYFFPHTTSGQLLIKYRPSTWSFKRGGARYTAAAMHSIHM